MEAYMVENLPDYGEEVLVTDGENVWIDSFDEAVGFSDWIGVAKYFDKNPAFVFEAIDKNYRGSRYSMTQFERYVKILGNIYENPELLKELANDNTEE